MGSLNDKEKEFKEILGSLEFDVNTDQIWERVSPHLKDKKKDRGLFFFLLGITLLAFFSGSLYYTTALKSENIAKVKEVHNSFLSNNSKEDIHNKNYTGAKIIENKNILKPNKDAVSSVSNNLDLRSNPVKDFTNKINNETTQDFKKISENKIISNSQFLNNYSENLNTGTVRNFKNRLTGLATFSEDQNLEVNSNKNTFGEGLLENSIDNDVKLFDSSISFLKTIRPNALIIGNQSHKYELSDNFEFINILKLDDRKWRLFFMANTGLNRTISNVSISRLDTEFDTNQFEKESGLLGVSSSIDIGIENAKGWKLFGSLSYNTQNSVYRNTETEREITTFIGTGQHIDGNGFVQNEDVELEKTSTTFNNINWNRRHQYLNIGIGVGKEIAQLGNWRIGVNSTLYYNLLSSHTGYYFEESTSDIEKFKADGDHNYRSNTGFSGRLAFALEWRYRSVAVGVSPFLQYRINSILENSNFYKTNDNHFGLNLTLTYRPESITKK